MGEKCCCGTTCLVVLVVILSITTLAQLPVIIWKAVTDGQEELPKALAQTDIPFDDAVDIAFPGYFRTETQQAEYEQTFLNANLMNRTVVTETYENQTSCGFVCGLLEGRKKRQSSGATTWTYHGCCKSSFKFTNPNVRENIKRKSRTIVQLGKKKQYFTEQECVRHSACTGCTCSKEKGIVSAVVSKSGDRNPTSVKRLEVDLFYVDGCCKCVNT